MNRQNRGCPMCNKPYKSDLALEKHIETCDDVRSITQSIEVIKMVISYTDDYEDLIKDPIVQKNLIRIERVIERRENPVLKLANADRIKAVCIPPVFRDIGTADAEEINARMAKSYYMKILVRRLDWNTTFLPSKIRQQLEEILLVITPNIYRHRGIYYMGTDPIFLNVPMM